MTRIARAFFPIFACLALAVSPAIAKAGDTAPNEAPPPPPAAPPWLGVAMDNGGDTGVRVEHVVRGSPAERAGVHAADRIVSVDGNRVTRPQQVSAQVATHKIGETVKLDLERTGTAMQVSVTLASRPSTDQMMKMDLVGAPAPAWAVTPIGTAPASVAALRGRVVLVDFWATWCGPCKMIAPHLSQMKDRLGAQGLSVVGITTDDAASATAFADKFGMRYAIAVDKDGETNKTYGVSALPTLVLIDKSGVIRDVFIGYDPSGDAALEARIKELLAQSGPPAVPPPTAPRPDGR